MCRDREDDIIWCVVGVEPVYFIVDFCLILHIFIVQFRSLLQDSCRESYSDFNIWVFLRLKNQTIWFSDRRGGNLMGKMKILTSGGSTVFTVIEQRCDSKVRYLAGICNLVIDCDCVLPMNQDELFADFKIPGLIYEGDVAVIDKVRQVALSFAVDRTQMLRGFQVIGDSILYKPFIGFAQNQKPFYR